MAENVLQEDNLFNDYKIENFDDDLQSRLYAEIYYKSNMEGESEISDIPRTIQFNNTVPETNIELENIQHKSSANKQSSESNAARASLAYNDTLYTQNSAHSHISVGIQKLHSVNQMEFVQNNKDKLSDEGMNSVVHGCNNVNDNILGDSSKEQEKENKQCSSKKYKSSNSTKNIHDNFQDISSKHHVLSKYEKQKILLTNKKKAKQVSDSSDSEDSIFEVPVLPKPKPPLINLQDSDEDDNINLATDKDYLSSKKVTNCELKIIDASKNSQNVSSKDKNTNKSRNNKSASNPVNLNLNIQIPAHVSEIGENITLNCTNIQKGAKSIADIQQLSKTVNRDVLIECTHKSSKKNSPPKTKGSNVDVQQNIPVILTSNQSLKERNRKAQMYNPYLKFLESLRSDKSLIKNKAKRNVRYFKQDEDQSNMPIEISSNNLDGKRQCDSEIDIYPKQKRQCTVTQNNINITLQNTNEERRDVESSNDYFKPMSENMPNYYCNSIRGQENFDVNELQRNMSKDPKMWAILDADLMPCPSSKQRIGSRNIRCNNCHQDGHSRYNCSLPRRAQSCYICGIKGHNEVRCPQKMCLTCGKQQKTLSKICKYCRVLYCTMCNSAGHEWKDCPDLWRRYHQTIDMNDTPQNPGNVMKPSNKLHCCNCTKRGHESSTCKEYRWSMHFQTPAAVVNYMDGPTYTLDATDSSRMPNMLPVTTDNVISTLQDPKNIQQTTEDYLEFSNIDALTSRTDRIQISQKSKERENLRSCSTIDSVHLSEERPKEHQQNWINEQEFVNIIFSFGEFRNKNKKGAQIILRNIYTNNLTTYGKLFIKRIVRTHQSFNPTFLRTLFKTIEFKIIMGKITYQCETITLQLIGMKDYIEHIYDLFIHWINLPNDEKDYGIDVSLPTNYIKMFNVLNERMPQLEKVHSTNCLKRVGGPTDPRWLYNFIKYEKRRLKEHTGNQKEYNRVRLKLCRLQTKLLIIVNTEPTPNIYVGMFRDAMKNLSEKRTLNKKIDTATYMKLILLYNHLFVPHTPADLSETLQCIEEHEKIIEESTNQLHQGSKTIISEQNNSTLHDNVNPTLCVSSKISDTTENNNPMITIDDFVQRNSSSVSLNTAPAMSCTPQYTDFAENPVSVNVQHNSNDNILIMRNKMSDVSIKTSDTTDHNREEIIIIDDFVQRNSQTVSLNTELVSVQLEQSVRNEGQPSTSDVNITSNVIAKQQKLNKKQIKGLTKKERKALNKQKKLQNRKNMYQLASQLIEQGRTFEVSHMVNAVEKLQRNINNQMLTWKQVQAIQKLIKLEKSYRRGLDLYCKNLKT